MTEGEYWNANVLKRELCFATYCDQPSGASHLYKAFQDRERCVSFLSSMRTI
jgi:hypothetical protein